MKKIKCRWCGKSTGKIRFYTIADNLEEPRAYHKKCMEKFQIEVIKKISDSVL